MRTTETDEAGNVPIESPALDVSILSQVVYTRDPSGQARLYVDGEEVSAEDVGGDLSNWLEGYRLGIGAELNEVTQAPGDHRFRHWEDELYRVAIYHRALTPQELGGSNFAVTEIVRDRATGEVVITWNSQPQRSYAVESSSDLTTWTELDDGVASEGESTSFTVAAPEATDEYYRVIDR